MRLIRGLLMVASALLVLSATLPRAAHGADWDWDLSADSEFIPLTDNYDSLLDGVSFADDAAAAEGEAILLEQSTTTSAAAAGASAAATASDSDKMTELEAAAAASFISVGEATELLRGLAAESGKTLYTRAREVGEPTPPNDKGQWKKVPNLTGAYARVGDTLSRTVSVVLQRVNLGVTVGARYQGCTKIDKVEMKIAEIAVQYRFRCVAKLDGYPDRELLIFTRDRYGVVDLLDFRDRGELKPFAAGDIEGPEFDPYVNAWYLPQTHVEEDQAARGV